MSLKNMAMKMALAVAAAKGMQALNKAGGIDGLKRKLTQGGGGSSGGFGGMLEKLGVDDRSGGMARGGGLGGMLGGLAGLAGGTAAAGQMKGLLDSTRDTPEDTPEEEQVSGLMIRAMVQAARADGEIDEAERAGLMEVLNDADPQEIAFLQEQMTAPVDPEALARDTPDGHEIEVYTTAVLAIEPDNRAEAEFLDRLARAMGIEQQVVNQIHEAQGKPPLYTI
ncbi:DUF533 domain-containing protein [Palleronia caenipelagi]|uniref:Tellurite resistance TerB family protein n=1 Tax=Palleronia caenipelagi TaxID=2489174 RepID=A0A547PM13_9RHOB|nr:DUF533 domain-containing protein [Palleronia caenipelagi]TRD15167.1 tellurite resistance TerB family protein [Palleronia caenipelagi]